MKKISIIIPTYNPGSYICELFSSIANQTLHSDLFEIIIVINGDLTIVDKISMYAMQYMPECDTKVIVSAQKGVSAARNIGLDHASGDYIAFIDDDDLISPEYLQKLLDNAVADSIVISDCREFRASINDCKDSFLSSAYNAMDSVSSINYRLRSFLSTVWGKLIPQSIIGNNRFNTKLSIGEDCCFMISLLPEVKSLIKADGKCVYYICNRIGSASRSHKSFYKLLRNKKYQLIDYLGNYRYFLTGHHSFIYLNRIISVLFYWK